MATYFDTSALAKRYIAELGSDTVDEFLAQHADECVISPLVATEFESILQRLLRQGLIAPRFAALTRSRFANDLSGALWAMLPFEVASFGRAAGLLRDLPAPLATLDALHLASAIELKCAALATSGRQLARAAQASGLLVHSFVN